MPFRSLGPLELGIVAFIILMVFGARKLPEIGGALGKGIRRFRSGVSGKEDEGAPEGATGSSKVARGTDSEERAKAKGG